MEKPTKGGRLAGVEIGLAESADLIGKSETHVLSLVSAGVLKRVGRGRYRPKDVARAALAFRESEDRRSSQTAESARFQLAKAKRVELLNGKLENQLLEINDVDDMITEIVGTVASRLRGVAAGSTRDLSVREEVQKHIDDALQQMHDRFKKVSSDLEAGRGIIFEDRDSDDEE
jgi:hypothetical protein